MSFLPRGSRTTSRGKIAIASCLAFIACRLAASVLAAAAEPLAEAWDYAPAMRAVAAKSQGRQGVVLHVGDSMTHANPYGQWARLGQGKTAEDQAALEWMHAGDDDDRDGWYLCRFDHPSGGRSYTAAGGLTCQELLAGGKQGLESLHDLLAKYRPQAVVLLIGSNDAIHRRPAAQFAADLGRALDETLAQGAIPIVSTIPPHPREPALAAAYNDAIRQAARRRKTPLIDLEREILSRRPDDWNGTLLEKNDVHLSAARGDVTAVSEPTEEHLRESGYLLRGWLSVRKIAEVKRRVFDASAGGPAAATAGKRPTEAKGKSAPKPAGSASAIGAPRVRLPVIRDTWFSNVGSEADGNCGGAEQLKAKSIQEMSLVDFDPTVLQGRVVKAAWLHVRLSGPERLHRVTVSSFAAPWFEGEATGYAPEPGSSTFNHRRSPDVPWSFPGSDLCDVMLGRGGTFWRSADASDPDAGRWQTIPVDPRVIAARVAGISYGCLVFDDTGSEWTRDGEKFSQRIFPNRFFYSREAQGERAPFFSVELGAADNEPPDAPAELAAEVGDLPSGEAWLSWRAPADSGATESGPAGSGPAGVLGYFVEIDGREAPRYLIPGASHRAAFGKPNGGAAPGGDIVRMHLRDLGLAPGAKVRAAVSAVDAAGNRGPASTLDFEVSTRQPPKLPALAATPKPAAAGKLPRLGRGEVAIIDALDKVQPTSGEMLPARPASYLAANHLWEAAARRIRLKAAKNEFVEFQALVRNGAAGLAAETAFDAAAGIEASVSVVRYVNTPKGPWPDPLVEIQREAPNRAGQQARQARPSPRLPGQTCETLIVEIYVPHDAPAGVQQGSLRLRDGEGQKLELPIELEVWDFTLPDFLSFVPEMNCYGLPADEREYYRLAHRHRTALNRVPYHHNGSISDGCAPEWNGRRLDWSAWDRRFAAYFDGTAFADLPRRGVPVDCFYLPLFENWPSPMAGNYNESYWADQAFPAKYRQAFVEVSRQMAEHFSTRGWRDTLFQFYLNGKNNFKAGGWSRGTCPWLLDEPANFQDYWALRYFGLAFHEGVDRARGEAKLAFRCDISRPEWQRDVLDGLLDYNVVGGAFRRYRRMTLDRQTEHPQMIVEYGSSNPIAESNVQPAAWCLDAWTLGADGVLPWQTIGDAKSWTSADPLALFYPATADSDGKPAPSLRLKSYRRGQQDVEYLVLWTQLTGQPRWAVGEAVRQALVLAGQRSAAEPAAGAEDAGRIQYAKLLPSDLWRLRMAIGEDLSKRRPSAKRRLVEFKPARQGGFAPGDRP